MQLLHSNLLNGGWGIYCPGCQQTLPKAYWRACQWKANGGRGHHEGGDAWGGISYTKCRTCQPKPIWETDPLGLEEKAPDQEMQWLSAVLAASSPQRFVEFVSRWMELIDAFTRKSWSYLGAVKGKRAGGLTQFDPGNWVYARVLGLLCPPVRALDWNDETKGDICEALLALYDDLISPNSIVAPQPQYFKDLIMELAPLLDAATYCVSKIYNRCPQSAARRISSLLVAKDGFQPLPPGFRPNVQIPALPWRPESPTSAQNQGSSDSPPVLVFMDAQPDGSGFEPSAPRTRARPLSLQSTGDGEVETKCVRVEIATCCKCVRFDDSVQSEGEGQGTAVGFQPLPAVDVGERRSGEEGGATGKGDGENQDNTTGFKLSPAEAGDGQGAEGKGDCAGNGEPAGFEPSPADAGKKKGGEGQGDGERQSNPTGFEPSPADVGKKKGGEGQGDGEAYHPDGVWGPPVPHDGPLEGVWARTRTSWDPSPRKERVGLAAAKDRSARGSDPAASRDPSDVGPTLDPAVTARPRWARANNVGWATPREGWADSCPDPSARDSGEGDAPVASTDPFLPREAAAVDPFLARVKKMDNDNILALSRMLQQGFLTTAAAKPICGELRRRGLAVPHGFEPLDVKEEGETDESSERPPS